MANCSDIEIYPYCMTGADGSRQTVMQHTEYRTNAAGERFVYKVRYHDAFNNNLLDPVANGMIGLSPGVCEIADNPRKIVAHAVDYSSANIAPDYDPSSNGTKWIMPPRTLSFTVYVRKAPARWPSDSGRVVINMPTTTVNMLEGESFSWTVPAQSHNFIAMDVSVEADGADVAFTVLWTTME